MRRRLNRDEWGAVSTATTPHYGCIDFSFKVKSSVSDETSGPTSQFLLDSFINMVQNETNVCTAIFIANWKPSLVENTFSDEIVEGDDE